MYVTILFHQPFLFFLFPFPSPARAQEQVVNLQQVMLRHRRGPIPDYRVCSWVFPADISSGRGSGELTRIVLHYIKCLFHNSDINSRPDALKDRLTGSWEHTDYCPSCILCPATVCVMAFADLSSRRSTWPLLFPQITSLIRTHAGHCKRSRLLTKGVIMWKNEEVEKKNSLHCFHHWLHVLY